MAEFKAKEAEEVFRPVTATAAGSVTAVRGEVSVPATLAQDDTINFGDLPAGHKLVDFIADSDDLDSGGSPALALKFGVGADDDAIIASSTVGQAGGVARMDQSAGLRMAASDSNQKVFATVVTTAATPQAGVIAGTFLYRPKGKYDS